MVYRFGLVLKQTRVENHGLHAALLLKPVRRAFFRRRKDDHGQGLYPGMMWWSKAFADRIYAFYAKPRERQSSVLPIKAIIARRMLSGRSSQTAARRCRPEGIWLDSVYFSVYEFLCVSQVLFSKCFTFSL